MKRTKLERIRLGILFVLVGLFFTIATARLVHLQVFQSTRYSAIVKRQSSSTLEIPAERGGIYDRNGQLVAKNVVARSLYAYPHNAEELRECSRYIDRFFSYKAGTAKKKFRLQVRKFSWVKRRLSDDIADRIEADAPRGLRLREESRRIYPFGNVGKQILGFTDIDNIGQSGFELTSDSVLKGINGTADVRKDGLQKTYQINETALVQPEPGRSSVLSIDWRLQEIVEAEIKKGTHEYNAQSAMAVFMDCRTGDILAAAHYDPEEKHPSRPNKLRAVTDQFEPGSVFKIFTAAALLDANLVDFSDTIFCEEGKWKLGRRTLHDDKKHGWLNFRSVIELSSNIGIAKYAMTLPPEELFDGYRRFGFGQKLRCGFPGETAGRLVRPTRWSEYNVAALSMGHSVAVSSLQLANAIGAVANGGQLMRPRLLLGWLDDDDYLVRESDPQVLSRALQESSVDSLKAFLRGVVVNGTATPVNSEVVEICGKTGTAEIPNLEKGGYDKNRFNASFGGFFPYESPVVAGVVVYKNPKPVTYGGHTAGKSFRKIAENYTVINPDAFVTTQRTLIADAGQIKNTIESPDLVGHRLSQAREIALEAGVLLRCNADEGTVIWQFPPADRVLFDGDALLVMVETEPEAPNDMIDLVGLPIRMVAAFLHEVKLDFQIEGSGLVVKQSVKPGVTIEPGSTKLRLVCRQS